MNTTIDSAVKSKIRSLYEDNQVAKQFLDWCAERQRDARETKIARIANVLEVSRSEAVALAKALDAVGCGEFVVGRRGAPSRFVWTYSRISLGRIASGEADDLEDWVDPVTEDEDTLAESLDSSSLQGLTIPRAKALLAGSFGVDPSQIEINIRA